MSNMFRRSDLAVIVCYLAGSIFVLGPLWRTMGAGSLTNGGLDHAQAEWFLSHGAHALTHWDNPLFTTLMNAPLGVNLMANASVLGLALPLIPITVLFGPQLSFVLAMTAGLTGTATGWYLLFSRRLAAARVPAAAGGALCGFAPAMISHASGGHLNFVSMFLIPLIVWRVLKLRDTKGIVRNGVWLGLLVSYQFFIGAEALFITALGLLMFLGGYAVVNRSWDAVRPAGFAGIAIACGIGVVLLAYPIWWQFFGPQSYRGLPHTDLFGNDLTALAGQARESVSSLGRSPGSFTGNPTEENSFFGMSLLAIAFVLAVSLWRRSMIARAAAITAVVATILSLGSRIMVGGAPTGIAGPWALLADLPVFNVLVPTRLTLIAIPAIAVLLVLGLPKDNRVLSAGLLAAALLPIAPTPLPVRERPVVPEFFSSGVWRNYGRTFVSAIPFGNGNAEPMRWQIAAGMGYANVEGYFVGPVNADGLGWYTPPPRTLSRLMRDVLKNGQPVAVEGELYKDILKDVGVWQADAIVLDRPHRALEDTLDGLFGQSKFVSGVRIWDVRAWQHYAQ